VRRVRDIGLPGWLGLSIPCFFAADWQFLVTAAAPDSLAFSAGILVRPFPYFTLLGLTGTVILCAAPSGSQPSSVAVSSAAGIPVKKLLLLALVPAAIAFELGLPDDVTFWLALLTMSVTIFLPTLALYFGLVLGLYLAATRRDEMSAGILVLALLPFADWGYAQWSTARAREQETREIAAIPTTPVANIPATLVWDAFGGHGENAVWTIPAIQHVIEKSTHSSSLQQLERPAEIEQIKHNRRTTHVRSAPPTPVATLPDEYLLLKVGGRSDYAKRSQIYAGAGGPFELHSVHSGQDDLVAVWYRAFNPRPTAMPLLTLSGWYRGPNTTIVQEIDASLAGFLARALPSSD
jgi:hypothetical protein